MKPSRSRRARRSGATVPSRDVAVDERFEADDSLVVQLTTADSEPPIRPLLAGDRARRWARSPTATRRIASMSSWIARVLRTQVALPASSMRVALAELDEWRNVRCAQLHGHVGHGIESDDFDGNRQCSCLAHDLDWYQIIVTQGQEMCRCAGAPCAARARQAEAKVARCFCIRKRGNDAGGRSDLCGGHAGFSPG